MNVMAAGQILRTREALSFSREVLESYLHAKRTFLRGEYLSTNLGMLQMGEFGVHPAWEAEIETDFQLDSGVWTRNRRQGNFRLGDDGL
jgi:hypothetical protein